MDMTKATRLDAARSAEAIARIRRLYAIEDEIKEKFAKEDLAAPNADALRLRLGQEKSAPERTAPCHWLKEQQPPVLPKSPIGEAIA
jgi:hypothetical protein